MKIGLIFAQSVNGAFGLDNKLPWPKIKEDMNHFAETTKGHAVVMGRSTWESLPKAYRPLSNRTNIVLSKRGLKDKDDGVFYVNSFELVLATAKVKRHNELWIIGGAQLIEQFQHHASVAVVTMIDADLKYDVKAPTLDKSWELKTVKSASYDGAVQAGLEYSFCTFVR